MSHAPANDAQVATGDFEAAADAVVTGDLPALRSMLNANPGLATARSTRAHHATLLHYVAANGVEDARQRTPANAVEIARTLLDAGAEVDALADMYDQRCTAMSMLVSSIHPARAGVQSALAELLLDYGAAFDGPGTSWQSTVSTALTFGFLDTARTLAARGGATSDVDVAAASDGTRMPSAFFRPPMPRAAIARSRLPHNSATSTSFASCWPRESPRTGTIPRVFTRTPRRCTRRPRATTSRWSACSWSAAPGSTCATRTSAARRSAGRCTRTAPRSPSTFAASAHRCDASGMEESVSRTAQARLPIRLGVGGTPGSFVRAGVRERPTDASIGERHRGRQFEPLVAPRD